MHTLKPDDIDVQDLAWGDGEWTKLDRWDDGGRRWTKGTTTVCRHKKTGEIWAVDWEFGLTENQDHMYDGTPYPMESYEAVIPATTVTRYRKVQTD